VSIVNYIIGVVALVEPVVQATEMQKAIFSFGVLIKITAMFDSLFMFDKTMKIGLFLSGNCYFLVRLFMKIGFFSLTDLSQLLVLIVFSILTLKMEDNQN